MPTISWVRIYPDHTMLGPISSLRCLLRHNPHGVDSVAAIFLIEVVIRRAGRRQGRQLKLQCLMSHLFNHAAAAQASAAQWR